MLRNASAINGYAIAANDGRLGTVSDFLFDDTKAQVRRQSGSALLHSPRRFILMCARPVMGGLSIRKFPACGRAFHTRAADPDAPEVAMSWNQYRLERGESR